jgi:hypothetical protein
MPVLAGILVYFGILILINPISRPASEWVIVGVTKFSIGCNSNIKCNHGND